MIKKSFKELALEVQEIHSRINGLSERIANLRRHL